MYQRRGALFSIHHYSGLLRIYCTIQSIVRWTWCCNPKHVWNRVASAPPCWVHFGEIQAHRGFAAALHVSLIRFVFWLLLVHWRGMLLSHAFDAQLFMVLVLFCFPCKINKWLSFPHYFHKRCTIFNFIKTTKYSQWLYWVTCMF